MSRLDELAALWERDAQDAATGILVVRQAIARCARELRTVLTGDTLIHPVKLPRVAPGQVEAFGEDAPACVLCGRKLRHPVWLHGAPYGRVCARKERAK